MGALLLAAGLAACGGGGASSSSGLTLAEGSGVANEPASGTESASGSESGAASSQGEASQEERHMMTVDETMDYFRALDPALLDLDAASMDEYQIYPSEKAIPVDGLPCMKIIVYGDSEFGTNEPVATFLVARDGTALYRLEGDVAEKVDF